MTFARPEYDEVADVRFCCHRMLIRRKSIFTNLLPSHEVCDCVPDTQEGVVLAANMNRVPVLEVRDAEGTLQATVGQSKAIERFVARQLHFMGRNEIEAAQIDMICEHM